MFEGINWETYFPVTIKNLDKDLYLTVVFSEPEAGENRSKILFAFINWEKANEKMTNIEISLIDEYTLSVKAELKNNMAEDMGEILPLLNNVKNIAEVIVGEENPEEQK